jgi:hypothetical protein
MREEVRLALIDKMIRHLEPIVGPISDECYDGVTSEYAQVAAALTAVMAEERVTLDFGAPLEDEIPRPVTVKFP